MYGLPWWLIGTESALNAGESGDMGLIPGLGRSPGGGRGNPLQYSCPGNTTDWGLWRPTVHGVVKSGTQFSDWACTHTHSIPNTHLWIGYYLLFWSQQYSYEILLKQIKPQTNWNRFCLNVCSLERGNENLGEHLWIWGPCKSAGNFCPCFSLL